jgi:hypothetical protein
MAALPFTQTIPETVAGCKTKLWLQCSTANVRMTFHLSDNSLSAHPCLRYAAATAHRRPPGRRLRPYAGDWETFTPAGFCRRAFFLLL